MDEDDVPSDEEAEEEEEEDEEAQRDRKRRKRDEPTTEEPSVPSSSSPRTGPGASLWVYMMSVTKELSEKNMTRGKQRSKCKPKSKQRRGPSEWFTFETDGICTEIGITRNISIRVEQHNRNKPNGPSHTKYGEKSWKMDVVVGPFSSGAHAVALKWQTESNGYIGRMRRWLAFLEENNDFFQDKLFFVSERQLAEQIEKCSNSESRTSVHVKKV